MFKDDRAHIQCCCADENYSEKAENDSDDAAKMQKVDAQESFVDSMSSMRCATSRDPSEKSIAVQVLKNVDGDRMSRIKMQNLRLSLIFPKASLCL